jgi:hypothetical protein
MAFRIHKDIERGEIDNTVRGKVTGRIWLAGQEAPLVLNLTGNCHPDIAGCRLTFTNPQPGNGEHVRDKLAQDQSGQAGDMTASRRVRVLEESAETLPEALHTGKRLPSRWANCLYLEWYSERNGRVVLETTDFDVRVSEPQWRLCDEEADDVRRQAASAFDGFLSAVEEAMPGPDDYPVVEDRPMDEFEWEEFMKHSDRRSSRFGEVLEKYVDDPDRERKIDTAMGWKHQEDSQGDEGFDLADSWQDEEESQWDQDDQPEMLPNPLTKGTHWIESDSGRPCHPLYHQAFEFGNRMFHICKDAGLQGEGGDENIDDMIFKTHCTTAKLAGALNSLAYEKMPVREPGFIVANLKRALNLLKEALNAQHKAAEAGLLPEHMDTFAQELFAIRDGILALCDEFRRMGERRF